MIIDDDFIDTETKSYLYSLVLSDSFKWFPANATAHGEATENYFSKYKDGPQLTHSLYSNNKILSDYFPIFKQLFETFCKKNNIPFKAIVRSKINFSPRTQINHVRPAHVDHQFEHNVFIYYFNDSDGETIVYDQYFDDYKTTNLTECDKIMPAFGRGLVFDGLKYHSPTTPCKSDFRIILNTTFV